MSFIEKKNKALYSLQRVCVFKYIVKVKGWIFVKMKLQY